MCDYTWMVEREGLTILQEFDVFGNEHYLREIPPPPFRFHAISKNGPCLVVDVEPGCEYIWEHRVRDSVNVFSGERIIEDCITLGRRFADGREDVALIYPDGAYFGFTSLAAARAHAR